MQVYAIPILGIPTCMSIRYTNNGDTYLYENPQYEYWGYLPVWVYYLQILGIPVSVSVCEYAAPRLGISICMWSEYAAPILGIPICMSIQ